MSTLDEGQHEGFDDFAATKDTQLRERLIQENLPLASHLAHRFAHRGEPMDDLKQVASLALVNAVDRFDPGRDVAFAAFATRTIVGELKRHFRDKGWTVRPPRRIQELCLELNRSIEALTHDLGRSPTVPELAAATDASEADVIEALDAAESYWVASLDAPTVDGGTVGSHVGGADLGLEAVERRASLSPHLEQLPARERQILQLRFVDGLTQTEIAEHVGLSQMHVSRLLKASLASLRAAYGDQQMRDVVELPD